MDHGLMRRRSSSVSNPSDIIASMASTRKALCSFTPLLLQSVLTQHVAGGGGDGLVPHAHSFVGCLLICDISGFTRLSGGYCARGKEGLDELSTLLCGYMGKLVDCIYAFNGDVISFAGDALICVFRAADSSNADLAACPAALHAACEDAVCCAWTLRDIHTSALSLHVGISCGTIHFELLGGHEDKWTFLVSGRGLSELSQCLDDAPSKHVAITTDVYEVLASRSRCHLCVDYVDGCLVQVRA